MTKQAILAGIQVIVEKRISDHLSLNKEDCSNSVLVAGAAVVWVAVKASPQAEFEVENRYFGIHVGFLKRRDCVEEPYDSASVVFAKAGSLILLHGMDTALLIDLQRAVANFPGR